MTPLSAASDEGHINVVKKLVEHGAEIDQADNDGETPLLHASI